MRVIRVIRIIKVRVIRLSDFQLRDFILFAKPPLSPARSRGSCALAYVYSSLALFIEELKWLGPLK